MSHPRCSNLESDHAVAEGKRRWLFDLGIRFIARVMLSVPRLRIELSATRCADPRPSPANLD